MTPLYVFPLAFLTGILFNLNILRKRLLALGMHAESFSRAGEVGGYGCRRLRRGSCATGSAPTTCFGFTRRCLRRHEASQRPLAGHSRTEDGDKFPKESES
ncbi:MAG: hypothetical protein Q8O29_10485 [Polaromonas sp.]|uniref:hypothetical protein n=1 Tax=Polaromonas sp. TaxID=1869339 RepID=UPI0027323AC6|nr:hypothetical protein [Polaromonas sp.]MDP2818679.1 hypothetical protein [Polaromonas sp.]